MKNKEWTATHESMRAVNLVNPDVDPLARRHRHRNLEQETAPLALAIRGLASATLCLRMRIFYTVMFS